MAFLSVRRSISGEGKPRLLLRLAQKPWSSESTTTYTSTTVTEAMGSTVTISASYIPDLIDFAADHGLVAGDRILIAGHSNSDWNGEFSVVTVEASDQLRIDLNAESGGTGGTGRWVPDYRNVRAGMMVEVEATRSALPDLAEYARIASVDTTNKIITVDEWVGGVTPTANDPYTVSGWFCNLPVTQKMIQRFEPRHLVHELWRGRRESKFYGYDYRAELSWQKYLSADDLQTLHEVLNFSEDDQLIFIPHIDQPGFQYNVLFDSELVLSSYGLAGGHRGFELALLGKELCLFPILDGYGSHYATEYGTYL